ncbi:hypothetical protein [Ruminococcus albus]|uniref:Uncharacterized protein n=1 Tax=Ruminococcus albus 8 TaxID=246199 RepID=E9SCA0_RUMAL|nr:hypothetical protein [Ruminococcus albus]EGC03095.1 hypothetical protein CUS_4486 [Ruminococcus albus 8]MCC3351888.1 hypothetical protein [Ruminococcus albus 8]
MFTNQNKITEMLESLDKEIIKRSFIETFFGKQDPSKGYQLRSITILEKGALAEVYIKDRSKRDNDELRDGDLVQFHITEEDNCYAVRTDNEYEAIARERESKMETIYDDGILTEKIQNDHQNYYKVKSYDEENAVVICNVFEIIKARRYHKHIVKENEEYPLEHFLKITRQLTEEENETLLNITPEIKAGKAFIYKGIKFICLEVFDKEVYGRNAVLAVTAEIIKTMEFAEKYEDGCNDWRKSKVREWLNGEFLAMHISKDDVLPQTSDLTADNGDNAYGTSEDLVTLLSCDQYRKYRKLMPKYDDWVWTVTPYSCDIGYARSMRYVYPSGELSSSDATFSLGVAPVCLFDLDELNLTNK